MILYPHCKINVGLRVLSKREDGYHNLETVFYHIPGLHDELEVRMRTAADEQRAEDCHIVTEGIEVDCPIEDNLIYRCYRLMKEVYPQIGAVEVRFRKNIPFGAGLGGGSADATYMARALNSLFDLGLTAEDIARLVRPLGADCPFFAYDEPCYATGIGEELRPIAPWLKGMRIVMIKPEDAVSTREAYGGIIRHPEAEGEIRDWLSRRQGGEAIRWQEMQDIFINDFEQTVFPHHPAIAAIKKALLDAGALYAAMSGSGSTVFGLFEQDAEGGTDAALAALKQEFASMVLLDDTL